jgi:hypothetical protein
VLAQRPLGAHQPLRHRHEADRSTLIRRLSFDLLGLPPSLDQVEAFMNDPRTDAYERLVDDLLASPHFGERWARHWLDLARYADSDGYEKDSPRPFAYLFRDWVIQAINRDLPFDQFSIEQLAGDLLPEASHDQKVATGFHRNTLTNKEGGVDQEEFRTKATVDRASTTATTWLGLTLGCAECHNHKYDPISQREFYEFYAFFNDASEADLPAPRPAELIAYKEKHAEWSASRQKFETELSDYLETRLADAQARWEKQNAADAQTIEPPLLPDAISEILRVPASERTEAHQTTLTRHYRREIDPVARALDARIAEHARKEPPFPPTKAAILAQADPPRPTQIHIRGDFLRKGEVVQPGTPAILHPIERRSARADRLDLARWLFDPQNPLTGRVAANHVWSHLFGRGLVATPDDFGTRGETPSHPELLDWLATELPRLGWSRKAFIRLIVTSAAYRQSANTRPDLAERDPSNLLGARQTRVRLEAETIRDAWLRASGLLSRKIGGPGVRPPLPADIAALGYAGSVKWTESPGEDKYRRGLYIFFQRTVPYPMLMTFDAPDSNVACTRRERSNTPLQALTLLNDPVFFECAQHLGRRVAAQAGTDPEAAVSSAFRISLSRAPSPAELDRLVRMYHDYHRVLNATPAEARRLAGMTESAGPDVIHTAALVGVSRAILNLDEFLTRE